MPAASLDVGPLGRVGVVWTSAHEGDDLNVYFAESDNGGVSYGTNYRLHLDPEGLQHEPTIAYDDSSLIHVLWEDAQEPQWDYNIAYACSADSGRTFSDPERITDANPHRAEYKWGRSILVDYTNNDGVRLQAWLGIPEDFQEGQRLPMLVNFYEKNSQNLHRYQSPRYQGSPNLGGYLSNGYLVMQPDIHLRTRTTHSDMLECVEAAVKNPLSSFLTAWCSLTMTSESMSAGSSILSGKGSPAFSRSQ